ncbi:MAG: dimethyl sulfoxide reductase anchor subunit family protein [Geminicoccaceae bacterium]
MHPAPSIIAFTTASGAGYGLLFLLAMTAPAELLPTRRWFGLAALVVALGLITLGLIGSLFHLGHPERAWRALSQWRSSWLSREGLVALLTYPPALAFGAGWVFAETTAGLLAPFALLAALGAALTVYCTSMIYASLAPIREWHHPLVPVIYLAFALMTGALLLHALLALAGAARDWAGTLALLATALAFALKAVYWWTIARAGPGPTPESATGLGALGRVRMLDPPHTQTNYLLSEMGFRVARRHAARLRLYAWLSGFVGASLLTLLALLSSGILAFVSASLAALSGLAGVTIERWLFFAEATHTVTLYYGRRGCGDRGSR